MTWEVVISPLSRYVFSWRSLTGAVTKSERNHNSGGRVVTARQVGIDAVTESSSRGIPLSRTCCESDCGRDCASSNGDGPMWALTPEERRTI